jgi:hypothetical protein
MLSSLRFLSCLSLLLVSLRAGQARVGGNAYDTASVRADIAEKAAHAFSNASANGDANADDIDKDKDSASMQDMRRELYPEHPPGQEYGVETLFNVRYPVGMVQGVYEGAAGVFVSSLDSSSIFFVEFDTYLVHVVAGVLDQVGDEDGPFVEATFSGPSRMCYDTTYGFLYVGDKRTGHIRVLYMSSSWVLHMTDWKGVPIKFNYEVQTTGIFPGFDLQINGKYMYITDTLKLYSVTSDMGRGVKGRGNIPNAAEVTQYASLNTYMEMHSYPQLQAQSSFVYSAAPDGGRSLIYVSVSFAKNVVLAIPMGAHLAADAGLIYVLLGDEENTFEMCGDCFDAPAVVNGYFGDNPADVSLTFPMHLKYTKTLDSLFIAESFPVLSEPSYYFGSQSIRRADLTTKFIETFVGKDFSDGADLDYLLYGTTGGYLDGPVEGAELAYPIAIDVSDILDRNGYPIITIADLENSAVRFVGNRAVPTARPTQFTEAPTVATQFHTEAPTKGEQFSTLAPTLATQFLTPLPTKGAQFYTHIPTTAAQLVTDAPTSGEQFHTEAPSSAAQSSTAAPSRDDQFLSQAPTPAAQFSSAAPTRVQQLYTTRPSIAAQFVTQAPTSNEQFFTQSPTVNSQFSTAAPSRNEQFHSETPTVSAQFVTEAPTHVTGGAVTAAPTAAVQFTTHAPTRGEQFLTQAPSHLLSTDRPSTAQQHVTSRPTPGAQFHTSEPTLGEQFFTQAPTTQQQMHTSAPTRTQQLVTAAPTIPAQRVTRVPTAGAHFVTPAPTRAQQFHTEAPSRQEQISTSSPTRVALFLTRAPTLARQFVTSVPTTAAQFTTSIPTPAPPTPSPTGVALGGSLDSTSSDMALASIIMLTTASCLGGCCCCCLLYMFILIFLTHTKKKDGWAKVADTGDDSTHNPLDIEMAMNVLLANHCALDSSDHSSEYSVATNTPTPAQKKQSVQRHSPDSVAVHQCPFVEPEEEKERSEEGEEREEGEGGEAQPDADFNRQPSFDFFEMSTGTQ